MLLSLSVKNYRSFCDETVLDMQRHSFKTLRPKDGQTWDSQTLRRAAIFGANASGKSNFLKPLHHLKQAIDHSLRDPELVSFLYDPHKGSDTENAAFRVEFVEDDIRFAWNLELDKNGVVRENLDAVVTTRWSSVYRRTGSELEFGASIKISAASKENLRAFMRPSTLVLSAWRTLKDPGPMFGALSWWSRILPLIENSDADQGRRHTWVIDLVQRFPALLNTLNSTIRAADVGIQQISIKEEAPEAIAKFRVVFGSDGGNPPAIEEIDPDEAAELFKYFVFSHSAGGKTFVLSEDQESMGTRAWIDLAVPVLFTLAIGGVLTIDEIDSSLHPFLVRELIQLFANEELNSLGAQLLFSTHDVTLLGRHPDEILERSELWLVEKNDSESELIALDEFPTRVNHNLEKQYLRGAFGAVPLAQMDSISRALEDFRSSLNGG